jgi:predicted permease
LRGIIIIAPLIAIIALGVFMKASGFMDDSDKERLTRLLYWVVIPLFLFRTTYLAGGDISGQKNLFLASYSTMLLVPAAALLASKLACPGDRGLQALSAMMSTRMNHVYLGLPVVTLALGDEGVRAASIYLAIVNPGYNLISIMWGEIVFSGGLTAGASRSIARRVLKNPMVVSSLLGLAAAQLRVPLPDVLLTSMKLVSDMATGIALIALGMSLSLRDMPGAIRHTWRDVLVKLALHPIIAWVFLTIWPVPRIYFQAAIIVSSMPIAVNTFIVASGMGLDEKYACEAVALSTMLMPVAFPIWAAVMGV